jgi:ATP-dependent exoDNAse (exonuclease V) alpha subunit
MKADQIICGRNKTRTSLNREMRAYHGIAEEQLLPIDGEKLICTLNDWEKSLDEEGRFHLVNGVIGVAKNVRECLDEIAMMDFYPDFIDSHVSAPFDVGIFTEGMYRHGYGERAVTLSNGMVVHEASFGAIRGLKAIADEPICRFEFAYAVTCHKAQGSEFDFVIVFDESWAFGEERNRWLYTAITRAKEKLLIIR